MKKLFSKAKGLTIAILFLLLSCKTIKEENTEMFKDFLQQEKINYKNIIYSSYYKDFFCEIAHKTHYKDSTFLKYNRIYIQEEPYPMLSLYIFHPSGKVFRSYMKLDNEKLSKPNDEGICYTKTAIKIHLEGGGFFLLEDNKLIFQDHFFNLGGNLPFGRTHNAAIYTDVIFGNIENDTITSYKMYRAKKLSFSKKIFEPAVKRVRKIYLEKDLHPALKEDCTNKEVYYLIPEGTKIELFGYKKR